MHYSPLYYALLRLLPPTLPSPTTATLFLAVLSSKVLSSLLLLERRQEERSRIFLAPNSAQQQQWQKSWSDPPTLYYLATATSFKPRACSINKYFQQWVVRSGSWLRCSDKIIIVVLSFFSHCVGDEKIICHAPTYNITLTKQMLMSFFSPQYAQHRLR